jgi:hypothetical protein
MRALLVAILVIVGLGVLTSLSTSYFDNGVFFVSCMFAAFCISLWGIADRRLASMQRSLWGTTALVLFILGLFVVWQLPTLHRRQQNVDNTWSNVGKRIVPVR